MEFDFVANATVDSLDAVPENYRGLYAEKDGKFAITDVAKGIVEAYTGVNTALKTAEGVKKTANNEAAERRVALKAWDELTEGLGVEDKSAAGLQAHIAELVAKAKNGEEVKINLDKINKDAERRIGEVTVAKDKEIAAKDSALVRFLVDQAATQALAEVNGSVALLLPHVKAQTKVIQDGDDYVVRVVDTAGDVRPNGKGGFMSVKDVVVEMKESVEFGRAFESDGRTGSGAPVQTQTRVVVQGKDKTPMQKITDGLNTRSRNK